MMNKKSTWLPGRVFHNILVSAFLLTALPGWAQWKPAGDRIRTEWGEKLNPEQVLPEYPRPQLVRAEWQNLNGLWNYAILPLGTQPTEWEGESLVPFVCLHLYDIQPILKGAIFVHEVFDFESQKIIGSDTQGEANREDGVFTVHAVR